MRLKVTLNNGEDFILTENTIKPKKPTAHNAGLSGWVEQADGSPGEYVFLPYHAFQKLVWL